MPPMQPYDAASHGNSTPFVATYTQKKYIIW